MKWRLSRAPSVSEQLSSEVRKLQASRRQALLKQLLAIQYLARQGIALRGHSETEGNLVQLLVAWAKECSALKAWLKDKKYLSHDIVNEQVCIMGKSVLRCILTSIKQTDPAWYAIVADEARDVANREQLNVTIRWVSAEYAVNEDPVGLFCLPDTTANTLVMVIKDVLLRCGLSLSLCRGQGYDGASNMQGRRSGVVARILDESPSALPLHCFAHSLNLCLQDAGRQIILLRDALDIVREIGKLIKYSPKRSHLLCQKLAESETSGANIKTLCPTRWTARTAAIGAVLKDYAVLMDTMAEVNQTTHDEYGIKAGGILSLMEKYDTFFGLKLAYLLFATAEEVSKTLQRKDVSLQEALSAVTLAKAFYQRQRKEEAFTTFYDGVVNTASELNVSAPSLPRYRRAPARIDGGSQPHRFASPRDYHRSLYYQACDLLVNELEMRFQQKDLLPSAIALESLLLKAACGEDFSEDLKRVEESCYKNDFDFISLKTQLSLLADVIKQASPCVRRVTSVRTIADAMNSQEVYKSLLSEVHKLIRLFLTLPVTSATSERTFSALRRLLTYLRATMTEKRLNNCLMLHVHKDVTDSLNITAIAEEFVSTNDDRKKHFGSFVV